MSGKSEHFELIWARVDDGHEELFCAPAFRSLKNGDMVIVDTDKGEQAAIIMATICLGVYQKQEIDFIMKSTHAPKELHRVISKVKFEKLRYEEEENEELQ